MFNQRMNALLKKAAAEFIDGSDPFRTEFLSENNVTLDECMSMSSQIGIIVSGFLNATQDTQKTILICGALADSGIPAEMVESSIKMSSLTKQLEDLKL